MSSAAVVEQAVAVATITTERGSSSAVVYQQAATATVAAEQGLAGPPGPPGSDGGVLIDLPDLVLLFENGLV